MSFLGKRAEKKNINKKLSK